MTNDLVQFNPDQLDLIKRTIAKDATNDELALFIHQCERTGLDPMDKQIYFQKRSGKVTIITAIDGFRLIAERTNRYAPGGTWWCGSDGEWKEVWPEGEPPIAAKVTVKKVVGGVIVEAPAVAHYSEYVVKYNGKASDMWAKMPRNQLAKCAEALALRKAFPRELSGLYTSDEMGQADNVAPTVEDRGGRPEAKADDGAKRDGQPSSGARSGNDQPALPPANVNPTTGEIIDVTTQSPPTTGPRTFPPPTSTRELTAQIEFTDADATGVGHEAVRALLVDVGKLTADDKTTFLAAVEVAGLTMPKTKRALVTVEQLSTLRGLLPADPNENERPM